MAGMRAQGPGLGLRAPDRSPLLAFAAGLMTPDGCLLWEVMGLVDSHDFSASAPNLQVKLQKSGPDDRKPPSLSSRVWP